MRKSVWLLAMVALAVSTPAALAGERDSLAQDLGVPEGSWEHRLHQLAAANPGFAGISFDAAGRATVLVTDVERPSRGVRELVGATAGARLAPARYDFLELARFKQRARHLLDAEGVVFVDLDEAGNRIRVGIDRGDAFLTRLDVEGRMPLHDLPGDAVELVEVEPIRQLITVRERFRPVPAGVQIYFSGFVCTLGANAFRAGVFGFITNSHCTNTQGGVESTRYYQHQPSGGAIATEIADPAYFTGGACPGGRRCRYSDASFARYDSTSLGQFARIARTTSRSSGSAGSLTVSSTNPRFFINARTSFPSGGEQLNKVGRTSGWTYGTVTNTCVDTNVSGTTITQLCQDHVQAYSAGGDSGSPVFRWTGTSNANFYGLMWGGGGGVFVFSAISNIESELGALTLF
jgi:hypothetical protein